jgi:hypothetical protein
VDPNFFHVDLERAFELLVALVLLSLFLERALALLFEHRWYLENFDGKGFKTVIAFGVALYVCWYWKFDAVSIIVLRESTGWAGYVITAGVIAGGSKASLKLFHDFLGIRSTALRERDAAGSTVSPAAEPSTEPSSQPARRGTRARNR